MQRRFIFCKMKGNRDKIKPCGMMSKNLQMRHSWGRKRKNRWKDKRMP